MSKLPFSYITVLCEDRNTYHFVRAYLTECGIDKKKIFCKISPKGSAFDFVLAEYPKEASTYHSKKNHLSIALIVILDDDGHGTKRLSDLEKAYSRQFGENIAIFIPSRNIETWFEYAIRPDSCRELGDDGKPEDYKKKHRNTEPTLIAKIFKTEICQSSWKYPLLPSLEAACIEFRERLQEK